jgi:hypothetical protein
LLYSNYQPEGGAEEDQCPSQSRIGRDIRCLKSDDHIENDVAERKRQEGRPTEGKERGLRREAFFSGRKEKKQEEAKPAHLEQTDDVVANVVRNSVLIIVKVAV